MVNALGREGDKALGGKEVCSIGCSSSLPKAQLFPRLSRWRLGGRCCQEPQLECHVITNAVRPAPGGIGAAGAFLTSNAKTMGDFFSPHAPNPPACRIQATGAILIGVPPREYGAPNSATRAEV